MIVNQANNSFIYYTENEILISELKPLLKYDFINDPENNIQIKLGWEKDNKFYFYFGFINKLKQIIKDKYNKDITVLNSSYSIDKNVSYDNVLGIFNKMLSLDSNFSIREHQVAATVKALKLKRGILSMVTGSGKTEVISALCSYLSNKNILILNNKTFIVNQIYSRLIKRGVNPNSISFLSRETINNNTNIKICTTQTFFNMLSESSYDFLNYIKNLNVLLFDEGHHLMSNTWFTSALHCDPEYILSFTGTAFYNEENPYDSIEDLTTIALTGGVIHRTTSNYLRSKGYAPNVYVHQIEYTKSDKYNFLNVNWNHIYKKFIVENNKRNDTAISIIDTLNKNNLKTIVIIQRVEDHGMKLLHKLNRLGIKSIFVSGSGISYIDENGLPETENSSIEKLNNFFKSGGNIIIGSTVIDEGVDLPGLDAEVLLGGGKSVKSIKQRIGRIRSNNLNIGLVFDFNDCSNVVLKSHSKIRLEECNKEGFIIENNLNKMKEFINYIGKNKNI